MTISGAVLNSKKLNFKVTNEETEKKFYTRKIATAYMLFSDGFMVNM